jgi:uncharacterized protein
VALLLSGRLELHSLSTSESARMAELMEQYADTPMDLADASLMVVAETRNMQQVLTLDSDFYVYRKADGTALQCLP